MDYLETLRRDGWLADPGERVRVVVIHAERCPANSGRRCTCEPRLALDADILPRTSRDRESTAALLDAASGE